MVMLMGDGGDRLGRGFKEILVPAPLKDGIVQLPSSTEKKCFSLGDGVRCTVQVLHLRDEKKKE